MMISVGRDVYYFRCLEFLRTKGIQAMNCMLKPEGVLVTVGSQYEILVVQAWVDEEGEYITKTIFTVENDKDNLIEIIKDIEKRLSSNITEEISDDLFYNPYAPIIVGETLLDQILA